jgi:hypothetical protein
MAKDGIFDQLYRGVVDAIKDVREKVVEEPWYGRALSDRESATPQWPQAQEQEKETSFGGFTRNIDVGPTRAQIEDNRNNSEAAIEPERNGPQWPKASGHAQTIDQERDRNAERDMDR